MRVLLTGSRGFVGKHLLKRLAAEGHETIVLVRGPANGANEFAGPPELADLDSWPSWPGAIDVVVHLAALNPSRQETVNQKTLHKANVEGTAALAARAAREGVHRMLFVSTANVHAAGGAKPVREDSEPAPQNLYARSKLDAEAAFWNALRGHQMQGCVLRPVPVFGTGGRGSVAALSKLARLPVPLPLKGLGGARSLVAVEDLVDAIVGCMGAEKAAGRTFLVANEPPLRPDEIVAELRIGAGMKPLLAPAPAGLLGLLAGAAGKRAMWDSLNAPFIVDAGAITEAIGWRPSQDSRTALGRFGEQMRKPKA